MLCNTKLKINYVQPTIFESMALFQGFFPIGMKSQEQPVKALLCNCSLHVLVKVRRMSALSALTLCLVCRYKWCMGGGDEKSLDMDALLEECLPKLGFRCHKTRLASRTISIFPPCRDMGRLRAQETGGLLLVASVAGGISTCVFWGSSASGKLADHCTEEKCTSQVHCLQFGNCVSA